MLDKMSHISEWVQIVIESIEDQERSKVPVKNMLPKLSERNK